MITKPTKFRFLFFLLWTTVLISFNFHAQHSIFIYPQMHTIHVQKKVELLEGDVEPLRNLKHIKIQYHYDSMLVCTFVNQEEYFNDLKKNYKAEKAERLISDWKELPKKLLEPKFEENLNKHIRKIGIEGSNDVTYRNQGTLNITIIEEEPHRHDDGDLPYVILRCTFLDEQGNLIVSFLLKAWGASGLNITDRREGSYTIAGNMLGKEIYKRLKKKQNKTTN